MRLKGESPSWMTLDVVDALLDDEMVLGGISCIARLQIIIVGTNSEIVDIARHVVDAFQFVALFDHDILFGRDGQPVKVRWWHVGSIAFHRHLVAGFVQTVDEWFVDLQGGFASCKDDER